MGCCLSSQRSQNHSPYPNDSPPAAASARNITTTSPQQSSLYTPRPSHGRRPSTSSAAPHPTASSIAPNAPLVSISPGRRCHLPHGARWTRSRLERERTDFFDTRVTGQPEIWGVVRMVVELIRQSEVSEAQGILDASGCTCPTGEVWRGIFDEKGAFYQVPEWVVVEPANLLQEEEEEEAEEAEEDDAAQESKGEDGDEDDDGLDGLGKGEKGKGRAVEVDPDSLIKVRARLSDRGSDVVVTVGKDERVGILVRRVKEAAAVPQRNKIKIGYLGRILHENESLSAQGWREGHVVNALVFQQS